MAAAALSVFSADNISIVALESYIVSYTESQISMLSIFFNSKPDATCQCRGCQQDADMPATTQALK